MLDVNVRSHKGGFFVLEFGCFVGIRFVESMLVMRCLFQHTKSSLRSVSARHSMQEQFKAGCKISMHAENVSLHDERDYRGKVLKGLEHGKRNLAKSSLYLVLLELTDQHFCKLVHRGIEALSEVLNSTLSKRLNIIHSPERWFNQA